MEYSPLVPFDKFGGKLLEIVGLTITVIIIFGNLFSDK